MTELERLIEEYCPNGVEYKTLGELGAFYGGLSGKSKDDFVDGNAKFITYMNVFSNIELNLDTKDTVQIGENESRILLNMEMFYLLVHRKHQTSAVCLLCLQSIQRKNFI